SRPTFQVPVASGSVGPRLRPKLVRANRLCARCESLGSTPGRHYCLRGSGVTIDVKHKGRTAKFLVIWMGQPGTREDGHVGLRNLQPEKNIWRLDLAQSTDEESYNQRP